MAEKQDKKLKLHMVVLTTHCLILASGKFGSMQINLAIYLITTLLKKYLGYPNPNRVGRGGFISTYNQGIFGQNFGGFRNYPMVGT